MTPLKLIFLLWIGLAQAVALLPILLVGGLASMGWRLVRGSLNSGRARLSVACFTHPDRLPGFSPQRRDGAARILLVSLDPGRQEAGS